MAQGSLDGVYNQTINQSTSQTTLGGSAYKSILSMGQNRNSTQVGLNPNMKPSTMQSYSKIFPMYGLWPERSIFRSTKEALGTAPADQL